MAKGLVTISCDDISAISETSLGLGKRLFLLASIQHYYYTPNYNFLDSFTILTNFS